MKFGASVDAGRIFPKTKVGGIPGPEAYHRKYARRRRLRRTSPPNEDFRLKCTGVLPSGREAKKSHIYIKLSENVISSPFSACSWFSKIESMFSKVQNAQLLDFLHMKGSKTLESSILHRMALLRIKNTVHNAI